VRFKLVVRCGVLQPDKNLCVCAVWWRGRSSGSARMTSGELVKLMLTCLLDIA